MSTLGTRPHIAFIGRAGAGKTTAAELLVKHFGYERLSFAAPLKVACGTSTDRSLLQNVGMAARAAHEDFWVNLLIDKMHNTTVPGQNWSYAAEPQWVIDDCRFPNEALALAIEGFSIVRIVAERGDRVVRLKANGKLQEESQLEHESETALDNYLADRTVFNDRNPEYLLEQLTTILNQEQR